MYCLYFSISVNRMNFFSLSTFLIVVLQFNELHVLSEYGSKLRIRYLESLITIPHFGSSVYPATILRSEFHFRLLSQSLCAFPKLKRQLLLCDLERGTADSCNQLNAADITPQTHFRINQQFTVMLVSACPLSILFIFTRK